MIEHRPSAWAELHATRTAVRTLDLERLPTGPGVIAFYRGDRTIWFGPSVGLRATLSRVFATTGPSALSPARRAVAILLNVAPALAIHNGRYRLTSEDHERVSAWLRDCDVGWHETPGEREAVALEWRLLREPATSGGQ